MEKVCYQKTTNLEDKFKKLEGDMLTRHQPTCNINIEKVRQITIHFILMILRPCMLTLLKVSRYLTLVLPITWLKLLLSFPC
jgi:hypothetical protein